MQTFTGWQYLLIDAANSFGLDKLLFEERIAWTEAHLDNLEAMVINAETKPLFYKSVQAIRKAQKGLPSGHLVGFDACNSGIQIMSAMTGCVAGATATGLVDPAVRADAYSKTTEVMNEVLHVQGIQLNVPREDAKSALMTSFYGSKKTPEDIFGKDTPELMAFHQAAMTVAPGAWELLQDLLASWQPFAMYHSWKLPDGYDVKVKVMKKKSARIEVDELDHATFTYEYYENQGERRGLSNAANVVHSVDAYVLRSIHRRCNYDRAVVIAAQEAMLNELDLRYNFNMTGLPDGTGKVAYYIEQYERSGMADVTILPYLKDGYDTQYLSTKHLEKLTAIVSTMLNYKPFPVIAIHDEFKCHPNNMNHLRQQYINIFAEIAESNILSDILTQIHGQPGTFPKLTPDLGTKIRGSNYALS